MATESFPDIIGTVKKLYKVKEGYVTLISDLLPIWHELKANDIEKNAEELLPHSAIPEIRGIVDRPFLTIKEVERNAIVEGFSNTDNDLKLPNLFCFKFNKKLKEMFNIVEYCIKYNIPYKDENNIVFDEVFYHNKNDEMYLRAYYIKDDENIKLTSDQIEKFSGVCGLIQSQIYESTKEKLTIMGVVEANILKYITRFSTVEPPNGTLKIFYHINEFLSTGKINLQNRLGICGESYNFIRIYNQLIELEQCKMKKIS